MADARRGQEGGRRDVMGGDSKVFFAIQDDLVVHYRYCQHD
jgi:hypothetical protein